MNKLHDLEQLINDESLPLAARRAAAEHYALAIADAIPTPAEDDPDVVKLTRGWSDKRLAELMASATNGRSLTGFSLPDALESVHRRRRRNALADLKAEHSSALVRDTAAQMLAKPYSVLRAN